MGLRSFLKNTVRTLRKARSKVTFSDTSPFGDEIALDSIEQSIAKCAKDRDSVGLINLLYELSLWKAPPKKANQLKEHIAQLFEEYEGKAIDLNASSSTVLLLLKAEYKRIEQERQAEARRLKEEADQLRQQQEQEAQAKAEAERRAQAKEQERQAEAKRLKEEADQLRQQQEQEAQAKAEAERRAQAKEQQRQAEAEDLVLEPLAEDVIKVDDHQATLSTKSKQTSSSSETPPKWMRKSIESLSLSIRATNCLHYGGIKIIEDLCGKSTEELLLINNFGQKSLEELLSSLEEHKIPFPVTKPIAVKTYQMPSYEEKFLQPEAIAHQKHPKTYKNSSDIDLQNFILEKAKHHLSNDDQSTEQIIAKIIQNDEFKQCNMSSWNELIILKETLLILESFLSPHLATEVKRITAWREIKKLLFVRYGQQNQKTKSQKWIRSLQQSIRKDGDNGWSAYTLKACGLTYRAISKELNPPITENSCKKSIQRVGKVIGQPAEVIQALAEEAQRKQLYVEMRSLAEAWIQVYGRLPCKTDKPQDHENHEFLKSLIHMNLRDRIAKYQELELPITSKEWDYHFLWISDCDDHVGNGYWKDFECLKQFLLRHAAACGDRDAMPKQTSLPRRVGGIVQNFGGQSKVAEKLGLRYQGQLVGDEGRTYWTDERLCNLIDDVNIYHKQEANLMPSTVQIYEFFREQTREPYFGKNPGSPIAGMTRQGKLQWGEVAERFNKKPIPTS